MFEKAATAEKPRHKLILIAVRECPISVFSAREKRERRAPVGK